MPKVPYYTEKIYIIRFEKVNAIRVHCVTNTFLRITALGISGTLHSFLSIAQILNQCFKFKLNKNRPLKCIFKPIVELMSIMFAIRKRFTVVNK